MSEQNSKFKVGDRIAVYTREGRRVGAVSTLYVNSTFPCLEFCEDETLTFFDVHHKQCRKLVKKPKETVWITEERGEWLMYTDEQYQALPEEQKVGITPYYKGKAPK